VGLENLEENVEWVDRQANERNANPFGTSIINMKTDKAPCEVYGRQDENCKSEHGFQAYDGLSAFWLIHANRYKEENVVGILISTLSSRLAINSRGYTHASHVG
jgi:hypothetical protein